MKNNWTKYNSDDIESINALSEEYISFLSKCKTERECVKEIVKIAESKGYRPINKVIREGKQLRPGDKVYGIHMNKAIVLFHIGHDSLENGMQILGAHIDSPRLDVKQTPLYEESGLAYFDTHYYGGIKKYQWVTMPLAIHGIIITKEQREIEINIGERETDPVFCISDLLIHLANDQMEKPASRAVEGENLDVIVGSMPLEKTEKDKVKAGVLKTLKDNYGISEEDFLSAELEIVPAGPARELGLDRSMVLSYGQDDRVCAFTSSLAMLESETQDKTQCCLLVDKEEIGSVGATGMKSKFFENMVSELINLNGHYSELSVKRCLQNSEMLSSDVNAGYDPLYEEVFSKQSSSFLGKGVVFNKFTGSSGKAGSNDSNAEYLAKLRKIMEENNVYFQISELGKVDVGGGGTIAFIMALYGMNVIDCGVPILSMHAPWEIASKVDIYEAYKCYKAFLKS